MRRVVFDTNIVVSAMLSPSAGDDADNRFLKCAAAAEAAYLVTGIVRHFPAARGRTRIITARQLIGLVAPKP